VVGIQRLDDRFAGLLASPVRFFFLSPSFLKSVSYQPLPERRNDGAVMLRFTVSLPHTGHVVGSASAIFCRRSKVWPQLVHSKA